MKIKFITGNQNKFNEIQKLLTSQDVIYQNIDLIEIQGNSKEIAINKCIEALKYNIEKEPIFVEDTCLCLDAWGDDLPGPYIKYFLKAVGVEGIIKMLSGFTNKKASAVCTIAFSISGKVDFVFQGITRGQIVNIPRGSNGFDWDSIFQPTLCDKTYAEMNVDEKNLISHRTKATKEFEKYLKSLKR
jgi:inosine triphosphate pyrophosphatase